MKQYMYTPTEFDFTDSIKQIALQAQPSSKEWLACKTAISSLPQCFQFLNYISLYHKACVYYQMEDTITRSVNLRYVFNQLTSKSNTDDTYPRKPLYFAKARLVEFGIEDTCAVHFVPVTGQITETFEIQIPAWAQQIEASELLNVSLALKLTPKHRVRVYKRNAHVFIFTTRGLDNVRDTDYEFYRKLWASIPYIFNWQETKPALTEVYKLLTKPDATEFWTALKQLYTNEPALKNIKYQAIIDTFKAIGDVQLNSLVHECEIQRRAAQDALTRYASALQEQRNYESKILAFKNQSVELTPEQIKTLYDKKIAYNLDTQFLNSSTNPKLYYRCASPCLNYDKEAALVYYNNRVKNNCDEQVCKLFTLLFVTEKVVILFDEELVLDFKNYSASGAEERVRHGNDYNVVFPNPHHAYYNCWGSYGSTITRLISEFKLEDLFYQIKAAVGSLNFVDYTVMRRFIEHLESVVRGDYTPACFLWKEENCTVKHTYKETIEHFMEEA